MKLDECEEEFDQTNREAHLGFHVTELYKRSPAVGDDDAKSDSKEILHWALVAHFPVGSKTYLFEAREENGLLQARRAAISLKDLEVSEKVQFFRTIKTSPRDLLTKAKQVPTGNYNALFNNWQTWQTNFLDLVSPKLWMTDVRNYVIGGIVGFAVCFMLSRT